MNFVKDCDREDMLVKLVGFMVDALGGYKLPVWVRTYNQVFRETGDWDDKDRVLNDLYMVVFKAVLTPYSRSWSKLEGLKKHMVDSDLSQIVS
jgi:hypothetical protein